MILDACCGSRMFYFNKNNPDVVFGDIRKENHILLDRGKERQLEINPSIIFDFRNLPFKDELFSTVIFDPPHLTRGGDKAYLILKYGKLKNTWQTDIQKGFAECFRVLRKDGTLIFKWSAIQIKVSEILELLNRKPLIGHISGKSSNTHWMTFIK